MQKRIEMLEANGHPCDKIEYIIKGGTWNAYPLKYQYWYILESFKACNNFSREVEVPSTGEDNWREKKLEDIQAALDEEQTYNETADYRIIGLTLETRPDAISPKTIHHMRRQGCTRIELGLQAPDDKILELIQRGHSVQQFRDAITLLRQAGFKVDLHFMPDLPGSSPEHDIEMYKTLFTDLALRPDMVKIYPCAVIKSAELYQWLQDGRYTPYGEEGLFRALLQMKLETPRYCRISRLIRDIPSEEIEAGNKITNLREELEKELHKRGQKCVCLRCREIGRQQKLMSAEQLLADPKIVVETYETIGGTEYFITMEDAGHQAVYGFLRLRLPEKQNDALPLVGGVGGGYSQNEKLWEYLPEIKDAAFIREL
ncbi:MAG: radical SAM protein, partial [Ignavibacteria bacterium]|nr:radical SAM protein [Ignavibacteria bacterium]